MLSAYVKCPGRFLPGLDRTRALAFERRSGVEAAFERRLVPDAGERAADPVALHALSHRPRMPDTCTSLSAMKRPTVLSGSAGRTALLTTRRRPNASDELLLMIAMDPFMPETSTTPCTVLDKI
jgi:hypothetical protein